MRAALGSWYLSSVYEPSPIAVGGFLEGGGLEHLGPPAPEVDTDSEVGVLGDVEDVPTADLAQL